MSEKKYYPMDAAEYIKEHLGIEYKQASQLMDQLACMDLVDFDVKTATRGMKYTTIEGLKTFVEFKTDFPNSSGCSQNARAFMDAKKGIGQCRDQVGPSYIDFIKRGGFGDRKKSKRSITLVP